MKRHLTVALKAALRVVQPTPLSHAAEIPVFSLGPSPIRWHRLFSQQTSQILLRFESLCRKGTPLKQELEEIMWKLKKAREVAMEEVNQTRLLFERRSVALLNAIYISPAGSQVLYLGMPTLLGWGLRRRPLHSQSHTFSMTSESKPIVWPLRILRRLKQETLLWLRFVTLCFLFAPSVMLGVLALSLGWGRAIWVESVRWTLERAGPAFIKWGQWGATRPDLLPLDLCRSLERLHSQSPEHSFDHTRQEIKGAFGLPLEEVFTEFEMEPVASGSIAQVYAAKLGPVAAVAAKLPVGHRVAVKVRHPHVRTLMERDFALMVRCCELASKLPILSGLRLDESMRQFGAPLHEQLDLRLEARNLERFQRNFRRWKTVGFPRPLFPLISESVLVESFEEGDLISNLVRHPDNVTSVKVSQTGLDLYLKMLIRDNFLHADLHPGNILVQDKPKYGRSGWWSTFPKLVLLDAGMVAELTAQDQHHVVKFFRAVTQIDGADVARTILDMSVHPKCSNPKAFEQDMKELFDGLDFETIRRYSQELMQDMLDRVRRHEVTLRGSVCTLMATTLVLEGWSTKLNPDICIMDRLKAKLPKPWKERLVQSMMEVEAQSEMAMV